MDAVSQTTDPLLQAQEGHQEGQPLMFVWSLLLQYHQSIIILEKAHKQGKYNLYILLNEIRRI